MDGAAAGTATRSHSIRADITPETTTRPSQMMLAVLKTIARPVLLFPHNSTTLGTAQPGSGPTGNTGNP